MTTLQQHPLEHYLDLIRAAECWRFSRWGDGEWRAVFQNHPGKHNCDGHLYFPDMGRALYQVLQGYSPSDHYTMGLQPLAQRLYGPRIDRLVSQFGWPKGAWHNADVFHRASGNGRINDVIAACRTRPILMVGPAYLESWCRQVFPGSQFVTVPIKDCWLERSRVLEEITEALRGQIATGIVALSCSMMAEVLIDDLDLRFPKQHLFVDFGSVWDPYAGRQTRKYHKDLTDDSKRISPTPADEHRDGSQQDPDPDVAG